MRDPGGVRLSGLASGVACAALLVEFLILDPFHIVDTGFMGVKTVFGAIQHEPLEAGLQFRMPFVSAIHEVSVQPTTSTTEKTVATHDHQNVTTRTVGRTARPAGTMLGRLICPTLPMPSRRDSAGGSRHNTKVHTGRRSNNACVRTPLFASDEVGERADNQLLSFGSS